MGKNVIVVGAGASGLMAAVFAARSGAKVTVLEGMDRPGKKLLMTGNGRCNITNMAAALPESYHGGGRDLAAAVIPRFDAGAVRAFFQELGLLTVEKNGYVYPFTGQASSVLEVLLGELARLNVKLKLGEKIEVIEKVGATGKIEAGQDLHTKNVQRDLNTSNVAYMAKCGRNNNMQADRVSHWQVRTATWQYQADCVILCCGSKCLPATGSDGSGYALAKKLGLSVAPVAPALTSLLCEGSFLPNLAGVRCPAEITLYREESGNILSREAGELQWTKYGISGIAVFQLSRFVSTARAGKKFRVSIDFFPGYETDFLVSLLKKRSGELGTAPVSVLLRGLLNEKLIPVVLSESGVSRKKNCAQLTDLELARLIQTCRQFPLKVLGTKSFDACQVCAGGVDARQIDPNTMECKKHPGLYLAGELLDVDGPCGGYNLQWAWSSGFLAGTSAARASSLRREPG